MILRRGLQLSLNMIVVTIISLLVLGIVVGFITGAFDTLFKLVEFPETPCQVGPDTPLQIIPSPVELQRGKQQGLAICFYNDGDEVVAADVLPQISCTDASLEVKAAGAEVAPAGERRYEVIVKAPSETPKGMTICTLALASQTDQFQLSIE